MIEAPAGTPDFSFQIPDDEALPIIFDLVQEEGLCLGGSSGINYMAYVRGHPGDFDSWAADGSTSWSYEDVLARMPGAVTGAVQDVVRLAVAGHARLEERPGVQQAEGEERPNPAGHGQPGDPEEDPCHRDPE